MVPQACVQVGHESAAPGSPGPAGADDGERCLSSEWGQLEEMAFPRVSGGASFQLHCGPAPSMEVAGRECPGQLVPSAHQVTMHLTGVDAQDHTRVVA